MQLAKSPCASGYGSALVHKSKVTLRKAALSVRLGGLLWRAAARPWGKVLNPTIGLSRWSWHVCLPSARYLRIPLSCCSIPPICEDHVRTKAIIRLEASRTICSMCSVIPANQKVLGGSADSRHTVNRGI